MPPSTPSYDFFEKTAKNSEEKAKILCMEKSTQFLISEALSQGIKVEILDQAESFIRLEKKGKVEYVKQATKTSKDTYVTYHLLSDKKITKKLLEENGLQVPIGKTYFLSDHQIDSKKTYLDYKLFKDKKLVVKPNETNFGLGISFIEENNPEAFQKAVEEAFFTR